MISQIKQKGFTIVELLIVIVVIAILAAISIAAYSNITARANTSTAVAAAKSVRDVAATFSSAHGTWPANRTAFTSGVPATGGDAAGAVAKLPRDIAFQFAAFSNGTPPASPKTVRIIPRTNASGVTVGFDVQYYDYGTKAMATTRIGEAGTGTGTVFANAAAGS